MKLESLIIVCPNSECKEIYIRSALYKHVDSDVGPSISGSAWSRDIRTKDDDYVYQWNLLPSSYAKVYPDYIPEVILADYKEACAISDLSPNASQLWQDDVYKG